LKRALPLCLAIGLAGEVQAAGRRPYGGSIQVPVAGFQGFADPHHAETPSDRLGALVAHCRLLAETPAGRFTGELAEGPGSFSGRTLTLTLREGSVYQDDTPVVAADVVASLDRLRGLGRAGALGTALEGLVFEAPDPRTVRVTGPSGTEVRLLRRWLARPEASVLRGGHPGPLRGCGPFLPFDANGERVVLRPFDRHPLGRPWLDGVVLVRTPSPPAELQAFLYGGIHLALEPNPRYRGLTGPAPSAWSTVFLVPNPRLRSKGATNRAIRAALHRQILEARLERFVGYQASPARHPWPDALLPAGVRVPETREPATLNSLTIAYPQGEEELERLARALRDALKGNLLTAPRAIAVEGLGVASAVNATDPAWDLALVMHHWAGQSAAEAAIELGDRLALPRPEPGAYWRGDLAPWVERVVGEAWTLPVIHVERPVKVKDPFQIAVLRGGLPDLSESWARP
jgi:hypothetical protein